MSKHGQGSRGRGNTVSGHTIQIDRADARQRRMLEQLLADCDPEDPIAIDFRGDRVVLSFAPTRP